MGKELKIDITNKIVGTFRNDCFELKANKLYVGKIVLDSKTGNHTIELEEGYLYENGKILKFVSLRDELEKNMEKVLNERK